MRKILLSGAVLVLFSIMVVPASAMPVAKIAPADTAGETAAVQVHYRRYYSRYSYRPRARGMCIVITTMTAVMPSAAAMGTTAAGRATMAADMVVDITAAARASGSASAAAAGNL